MQLQNKEINEQRKFRKETLRCHIVGIETNVRIALFKEADTIFP